MNYGELKQQFLYIANNENINTSTQADGFLYRGMTRIQRDIKLPFMEQYNETLAGADMTYVMKPNDFVKLKTILIDGQELDHVGIGRFYAALREGDCARYFTALKDRFMIGARPKAGTRVLIVYYGEMKRPVLDTDTNELTIIAPSLLIYAALVEAGTDLQAQPEILDMWKDTYATLAGQIQKQADEEAYEARQTVEVPYGEY